MQESYKSKSRGPGVVWHQNGTYEVRRCSDNAYVTSGTYGSYRTHDQESIVYEKLPKSDKRSRNCLHEVRRMHVFPYSLNTDISGNTQFGIQRNHVPNDCVDAVFNAVNLAHESPTAAPAFANRAFTAMSPHLESKLQLSNFLVEITDVKHFYWFFTKWKGLLRKISEGHLSYSFGIRPMLQDVKLIHHMLLNYNEIIDVFLSDRRKPFSRSYTEGVEPDDGTEELYSSGTSTSEYKYTCYTQYFAHMKYMYDCPDINNLSMKIKALRDMFGLRLTASVVWEAIPLSFVIDWLLRVQDWLKGFEAPLIPITVNILEFSVTYKYQSVHEGVIRYNNLHHLKGPYRHVVVRGFRNIYERKRCRPDFGNTFINRGQYGLNQLALSASLFNVRRRR